MSKIEGSDLGESLGAEYGTEVGSSSGLSYGRVERKIEGSSGRSDNGDSGGRLDMVAVLLVLGVDAISVAGASSCAYALMSVLRCSGVSVEYI